MPYSNGIKDQNVQHPNRFKINGVSSTIEPDFGVVSESGTDVNRDLITTILAGVGTTSGTASALTLAQPGFTLKDGATVRIKLHTNMAAGATLNVNGTGAKAIKTTVGSDYPSGATAGAWLSMVYSAAGDAWLSVPAAIPSTELILRAEDVVMNNSSPLILDVSGVNIEKYSKLFLYVIAKSISSSTTTFLINPNGSRTSFWGFYTRSGRTESTLINNTRVTDDDFFEMNISSSWGSSRIDATITSTMFLGGGGLAAHTIGATRDEVRRFVVSSTSFIQLESLYISISESSGSANVKTLSLMGEVGIL